MQSPNFCFICSDSLLLHIRSREKYWYCSRCREYFSASFQQQVYAMNCSRLQTVEPLQPYLAKQRAIPEVLAG
ncbi:hypothetical protein IQ250_02500 [Pseudanabaenaceae cyanobacterium LEGE 13415]|nr:hypothetical protein [Pseudanabaenaceae cyanobacterium LEGE 13415]